MLVAVWRLHSDAAIITTLVFAALVFFLWLRHVLKFSAEHPDLALLDGAEWTGWKRFEAAAKGYTPSPNERQAVIAPGTNLPELPEGPKSDDR